MRAIALALLLLSPAAAANLQQCAGVDDDRARLACYDALAGRDARPVAPAAAPAAPGADTFGKPPPPATGASGTLTARIVGTPKEWRKGTKFTLDNGQVWQVVSEESAYYPNVPPNPEVTITEVMFGYRMEIPAIGRRIKVKRIS